MLRGTSHYLRHLFMFRLKFPRNFGIMGSTLFPCLWGFNIFLSFIFCFTEKTCLMYPPPKNGALSCQSFGGDPMCQVQCKVGFDFVFTPPLMYLCSSGTWSPFGYPPFDSSLPWPDCSSEYEIRFYL